MNFAMIFCALATFCRFSTGNTANREMDQLTQLKSEVQSTTDDLTRYGKNLVYNTRIKLNYLKLTEKTNINDMTNTALDAIEWEIEEAKAVGKNVDHCFEPSSQRITLASRNSAEVLDKCATDALATVDPIENDINALLQQGDYITLNIDHLSFKCSSNPERNCIDNVRAETRSTINSYRYTAGSLRQTGDKASAVAQNSARSCYQAGVQTVRDESNRALSDVQKCVAND